MKNTKQANPRRQDGLFSAALEMKGVGFMKNVFKWMVVGVLIAGTASADTRYRGVGDWSDASPSPGWDNGVPTSADEARLITTAAVTILNGTAAVATTVRLGNLWNWDGGHVVVNSGGSLTATHLTMGSASANGGGPSSFTNHLGGIVTLSGELSFANGISSVFNGGTMSVGSLRSTAGGTGLLDIDGGTFTAGNILGFDLSAGSGFTIQIRNGGVLRIAGSSQAEADQLNAWHQTVGSITSDVSLFAVYNLQTDMTTLGPTTALDLDPPTPNPAGFASAPIAISSSEIWMTAEGSDASGWIQYRFDETSGNPGGKGSGWQTSSSYTDGGLSPDTQYSYTVTMRDAFGNTTTASPPVSATTAATDPDLGSLPYLSGKAVAIWSKGAEQFVRSSGVDDGVLRADRKSYEANDEGRFLCFAEAGNTIAIMDMMLSRYVTHTAGKLASAVGGDPAARRFTLEDQGNNYYAIKANNGTYVRVDGAGELLVDAVSITGDALFAIVPIRTGPNVVMRAYEGWEADFHSQNSADFPVNKVNIGMLQMTPQLYADTQFTDMRAVWNTDQYETEFILPYVDYSQVSMTVQVDNLINRIKRMEGLGYTFDYVILYHEILAGLPGGPWSDPRISSQAEIDLFRERVTAAYNAGEVDYPSYRVFCLPYQFASNSVMGFSAGGVPADTPVGCDAETLEFIKNNFDGMFLEVNGHDYTQRDEDADAAAAAVWCRDNGLEFGITSGGSGKDAAYKTMYGNIFAKMNTAGFDKSWDGMHYVLHHVHQPLSDRLPEWTTNTTTENAKWLIEQVMPFEAPSIAAVDTDGDGVADLEEVRAGTPILELELGDYDTWAGNFTKADLSDPTADFDGDGVENLMEYALGGSPINADAASTRPVSQRVGDYLVHVYNERTDDTSLTYTVELSTHLVSNGWNTNGLEFVGAAGFSNIWNVVTHKVSTLGKAQQFIRLKIEQD